MNSIPNIKQFLELIDPDVTINREEAMGEITAVVLLRAVNNLRGELSEDGQKKLDEILKDKEKFDFEGIYEVFDKAGKKEKILTSINDNVNKVRAEYIKTHLEAMPQEKKEQVLTKYPALKEL